MTAPDTASTPPIDAPSGMPDIKKPIVLVGLMGSGKSSIGKRLAKSLRIPFHDSDAVIEEAANCSITDIFEVYGESIFRDLELRVMSRLLSEEGPCVISTGGGAFLQEPVRDLILKNGTSIWLKAELDVLHERVSRKKSRPLLETGEDKRVILERLVAQRYPVYALANITVSSDHGAHENVLNRAMESLKHYLTQTEGA